MYLRKLSCALLLLPLLYGCERILDFNGSSEEYNCICANALAVPGREFTVAVSRTFLFTDVPSLEIYDNYHDYLMHPESFYEEKALLPGADVRLTVNGQQEYALSYNEESHSFGCGYVPEKGDMLSLYIQSEGFPSISAETVVPSPQRLEVLESKKYYNKAEASSEAWDSAPDTLMRLTLRIHDPAGEQNYYRLKVRSVGWMAEQGAWRYSDIYTSSDVLFMDNSLAEAFGGWPAYFSNVFDDRLFDGQSYTFNVETRMRYGDDPHVVVELQSLTPDLYHYLKSTMLYRTLDMDSYTEAVQIYSNVSGGWGIVGGLAGGRHVVPF